MTWKTWHTGCPAVRGSRSEQAFDRSWTLIFGSCKVAGRSTMDFPGEPSDSDEEVIPSDEQFVDLSALCDDV